MWVILFGVLSACSSSLLWGQDARTLALLKQHAAHNPLKISYAARPVSNRKVSLTFRFEQNPSYGIIVKPEPNLDVVKGESSILPAKLVPANLQKQAKSPYYGEIAPMTVTVERTPGLQGRITYFFCHKKDGFCARKTDKVDLRLP
ncbi:MAG: hypothetical protein HY644_05445 [Acidobacteria bacterium]|nr:hypothetical protein [Acidobacteriota bacterium]